MHPTMWLRKLIWKLQQTCMDSKFSIYDSLVHGGYTIHWYTKASMNRRPEISADAIWCGVSGGAFVKIF